MRKTTSNFSDQIEKLVEDYYQPPSSTDNTRVAQSVEETVRRNLNDTAARRIALKTFTRTMEAEMTKQFLPEIGIISQLISTNVLSPQDALTVQTEASSTSSILSDPIKDALNKVIKSSVIDTYKIATLCEEVLDECLFGSGSVPMLTLPAATIKKITASYDTRSPESFSLSNKKYSSYGIFRHDPTATFSAESVSVKIDEKNRPDEIYKGLIGTCDDISYLISGEFNEALKKVRKMEKYVSSFSSEGKKEEVLFNKVLDKMKNKARNRLKNFSKLSAPSRDVVGQEKEWSLSIKLPSEAVIPLCANGVQEKNLGYLVLYSNGSPLNIPKDVETYMTELNASGNGLNSAYENTISRLGMAFVSDYNSENTDLGTIRNSYVSFVESKLLEDLKLGILGDDVNFVMSDSIKLAMFSRAMRSQRTTVVYVPEDLMTYFAFNKDSNGVGISLLSMTSVIAGMRAALNYTDGLRAIKNTIGTTSLEFILDPKDPEPRQTVEDGVHAHLNLNRISASALGMSDIIEQAQAASVTVSATGNPNYPESKMMINNTTPQSQLTDEDTHLRFQKQHLQAFGVTPEQIDASIDIERVAQITTSNLMFYKRVRKIARALSAMMTDYVYKLSVFNGPVIEGLKEALSSSSLNSDINSFYNEIKSKLSSDIDKVTEAIYEYLETLEFKLQDPVGTTSESLSAGFDELADHLDKVLDACITSEIFNEETSGELGDDPDRFKAIIKSYYLRKYCEDNDFLNHVVKLFDVDDKGKLESDLMTFIARFIDGGNKTMLAFKESLIDVKKQVEDKLEKINSKLDPIEEDEGLEDPVEGTDNSGEEEELVDEDDPEEEIDPELQ